ncbi:MAG: PVC-type heme-binding CxxCH protein [Gemmataceae bacterium]
MRRPWWSLVVLPAFVWLAVQAAAPPDSVLPLTNSRALTPAEEKATFALPPGFRAELVASEPHIVDPVAMTFDERGRIWVCEMRGYPNGGRGTGTISSGRIRLLEDRDGDGVYETSSLWAENLRFPTGIMPWRNGLLVANAPELLYLEDRAGTGKADTRRVLYTGFDVANIQQLLNSLQFTMDNTVHGVAGMAGGTITSGEKPDAPAVVLRGRGVRFNPDVPASLEPTSGGGQYGLSADDWGRWFTATNSQHLRHIILPDHYLRRNPSLAVRAVTLDIPEHGAACKVYRRSPFEAWRVVRTTRRAGSADAKRLPSTELVPGGYVTSGCSPLVYTANLLPPEYRGTVFVCDPANNLILRDVLEPKGATFVAKPAHRESEFLASTDNWFRPVHLTLGPDGAIYVLDFYREVIETPLSLPEDILRRVMVESRGRGRIWRITTAPEGTRPPKVELDRASPEQLASYLDYPNSWWRTTAQRLLFQQKPKEVLPTLHRMLTTASPVGRAHVLWTLAALGDLKDEEILQALKSPEAGLREQALRLAEPRLASSAKLREAATALADDPAARVRFQLAFSLGEMPSVEAAGALAKLATRSDNDSWTQTALLSSMPKNAGQLLASLTAEPGRIAERIPLIRQVATLVGTNAGDAELAQALQLLGEVKPEVTPLQVALLDGLGQGLASSSRSLTTFWEKPSAALAGPVQKARTLFDRLATLARDEKRPPAVRAQAVQLLGRGPFTPLAEAAPALLAPRNPPEVQLATVRAISGQPRAEVAGLLLEAWPSAGPTVRREMIEALFGRQERLAALVAAMEKKQVLPTQVDPLRLAQLRKHPDATLRARATKALAGMQTPQRAKVIEAYRAALELKADPMAGKKVFQKNCATCHRLENVGVQVGADLLAALRNKTADALLIDILDPSREVDPRFVAYQVTTRRGQILSGIVAAETAASVTLKRGEGAEDTILRTQIDTVESTGKSLMPEGLEAQMNKQDVADLIAYLLEVGRRK